jgi:hypothetical protein
VRQASTATARAAAHPHNGARRMARTNAPAMQTAMKTRPAMLLLLDDASLRRATHLKEIRLFSVRKVDVYVNFIRPWAIHRPVLMGIRVIAIF